MSTRIRRFALAGGSLGLIMGLALGIAGLFSTVAYAQTQQPPEAVTNAIPELKKMGEGRLTWWGFHVYDSQLWSAKPGNRFDYRNDAHWLLLRYGRDFDGADIAERSREEIEDQGLVDSSLLPGWEQQMRDLFPDVKEGETLSALFLPNQGAEFFYNGKPLGKLSDPALATAFMGIWLDKKTSAPDLRLELLGIKR
ncbi:MAG: chalcone isomerase family protein [Limnobacter sp.]|nr:chalcone isomerase family protein [Limnobacter sp.]